MDPTAGIRSSLDTASFIARRILRHWALLVVGFAVAFGAVAAYTFTRVPTYRSETLVQVAPAILADFFRPSEPSAHDLKQRIHQLTLSRTRLELVLAEVQPYAGRSDFDTAEAMLAHFRQHIAIEMHGEDMFLLTFEHDDPEIAQRVTRRLVDLFIEERSHSRTARAEATARVLREQVTALLDDLGRREDALATFKEDHRAEIAALRRPGGAQVTKRPQPERDDRPHYALVGEAARELQALEARRRELHAQLQALRTASQSSPEIEALRAEIAEVQRERGILLGRFSSDYPDVVTNAHRLAGLQRRLASLMTPAHASDARVLSLTQQIADLDAEIVRVRHAAKRIVRPTPTPSPTPTPATPVVRLTLPEVEQQLERLEGELSTTREQHRETATRMSEADFALTIETQHAAESVKVIDPASLPGRPASPNRGKLLGFGALVALLAGLLLAFGAGVVDTRIFEEGDLARAVDLPVLVTIPTYPERA